MSQYCENCKRLQDELDNWKARSVKLEAALRDDGLADDIAEKGRHDASVIRDVRLEAITGYRARLLALIDEGGES